MTTTIRVQSIKRAARIIRRFSSSARHYGVSSLPKISQSLSSIDLDAFRKNAFRPEKPLLISNGTTSEHSLPAGNKWFTGQSSTLEGRSDTSERGINLEYLSPFADTILPYEYHSPPTKPHEATSRAEVNNLLSFLNETTKSSPDSTFHRFNAPLAIFLTAITLPPPLHPTLYIAQAQLADLPLALQADLPTPRLVTEAGKGDIYDANLWMGIPPTYTPLHKDPNPNLFVQLASRKRVRLFSPRIGMEIFRAVQMRIGRSGEGSLRGDEMMEGPERGELERAVWGEGGGDGGFEGLVEAGDALFIPRGWWHSVKSEAEGVNASVNWWFR